MSKVINILKYIYGSIVCMIKKEHVLGESASCPFTGKTYTGCTRCGGVSVK